MSEKVDRIGAGKDMPLPLRLWQPGERARAEEVEVLARKVHACEVQLADLSGDVAHAMQREGWLREAITGALEALARGEVHKATDTLRTALLPHCGRRAA